MKIGSEHKLKKLNLIHLLHISAQIMLAFQEKNYQSSLYSYLFIYLFYYYYFAAANDILETLDLSWNHLRQKGAIAVARGLKVSAQGYFNDKNRTEK